jgi:hypothetical protein
MAATILTIADALVTSLNGASFTSPYASLSATRSYTPRYTLEELANLKVTVVPPGMGLDLIARAEALGDFQIAVGVQKRTDGSRAAVDALVLLVEEIARHCLTLDLGDAHAVSVATDPLYDAGLLREERTFTGVVVVTFQRGLSL